MLRVSIVKKPELLIACWAWSGCFIRELTVSVTIF
jgi:hypothetical protein